jgi:hypothetical protein
MSDFYPTHVAIQNVNGDITPLNRFPVDAAITTPISVGAVTIKDPISGDEATVQNLGGTNALVTIDQSLASKTVVNVFDSQSIGPGASLSMSNFTVPAGKKLIFSGGIVGGEESATFESLKHWYETLVATEVQSLRL